VGAKQKPRGWSELSSTPEVPDYLTGAFFDIYIQGK
jgi:hypothetical protein